MYIAFIFTSSANVDAFSSSQQLHPYNCRNKVGENAQNVMNVKVSGRCTSIKNRVFPFPRQGCGEFEYKREADKKAKRTKKEQ